MGITPAPADPDAPGPFAFADEERLRAILSGAGFGAIEVQRFDSAVTLGATPRSAAEAQCRSGRFPAWCARWASSTSPSFSMLSNARSPRLPRRMAT